MKNDDTKLQKIIGRMLKLLATEAYAKGDGFEYKMVEQDVKDCINQLPLPHSLKQVRGAIYKSKGKEAIKNMALWLVTSKASTSSKLSDEVALYILSCTDDRRIGEYIEQRTGLSDIVMDKAKKLAKS